jgi:hypothetical protein
MQLAVRQAGSPERVNDSFETSPSHRMKGYFAGYDKKLHVLKLWRWLGWPAFAKNVRVLMRG